MIVAVSFVVCSAAFAGAPSVDQFLPSAGRGPGVGGDFWVTSVVIYNPDITEIVSVNVMFLERNADNSNPLSKTLFLEPGQQKFYKDFFTVLGIEEGFGALHVVSDFPVVVGSRIFNNNVITDDGVGTAGQWVNGIPYEASRSYDMDLVGLKENADFRTNIAMVEVTGREALVILELYEGDHYVSTRVLENIQPYEVKQWNIRSLFPDFVYFPSDEDFHIHMPRRATEHGEINGQVLLLGSVVDNITGDPTTVETTVQESLKPIEGVYVAGVQGSDLSQKGAIQFQVQEGDDGNFYLISVDWFFVVQCNDDPFTILAKPGQVTGIADAVAPELEGPHVGFGSSVFALGDDSFFLDMLWDTNILPDGSVAGVLVENWTLASGATFGPCVGDNNQYTVLGHWVGPLPPTSKVAPNAIANANHEPIYRQNHDGSVEMVAFETK